MRPNVLDGCVLAWNPAVLKRGRTIFRCFHSAGPWKKRDHDARRISY